MPNDPRSPLEQFAYLMSGTEDARRKFQQKKDLKDLTDLQSKEARKRARAEKALYDETMKTP